MSSQQCLIGQWVKGTWTPPTNFMDKDPSWEEWKTVQIQPGAGQSGSPDARAKGPWPTLHANVLLGEGILAKGRYPRVSPGAFLPPQKLPSLQRVEACHPGIHHWRG